MKVVFGGAFNPVTNAHLKVHQYIKDKLDISEFVFLPVSNSYTKSELASNHHRLEMLKLALKGVEKASVCTMELDDSKFLGTYQSLIRLYDQNNEKVAFVIGADNLKYMDSWINIEGILSEFIVIVLGRNGIDIKSEINKKEVLQKYKNSFVIFEDFNIEISSTKFRETFDSKYVQKDVYDYVVSNSLYRGDDDV